MSIRMLMKMTKISLFTVIALICLVACSPDPVPVSPPAESIPPAATEAVDQPSALTGKELVDIHCVRCHLAPNPGDLPDGSGSGAAAGSIT